MSGFFYLFVYVYDFLIIFSTSTCGRHEAHRRRILFHPQNRSDRKTLSWGSQRCPIEYICRPQNFFGSTSWSITRVLSVDPRKTRNFTFALFLHLERTIGFGVSRWAVHCCRRRFHPSEHAWFENRFGGVGSWTCRIDVARRMLPRQFLIY